MIYDDDMYLHVDFMKGMYRMQYCCLETTQERYTVWMIWWMHITPGQQNLVMLLQPNELKYYEYRGMVQS